MSKQTLKDVQTLIAEADEAARRAAEIAVPPHEKALEAARALVAEKDKAVSDGDHRRALAEIIENAVDAMQPDPTTASNVLQQYLIQVGKRDISATAASDGAYLWSSLNRSTWDWPSEMRAKIIAAMVLATRGEIDPGLARFSREWSGTVELPALRSMADFMDADAVAKRDRANKKAEKELADAYELMTALEANAPALGTVYTDEPERAAS